MDAFDRSVGWSAIQEDQIRNFSRGEGRGTKEPLRAKDPLAVSRVIEENREDYWVNRRRLCVHSR